MDFSVNSQSSVSTAAYRKIKAERVFATPSTTNASQQNLVPTASSTQASSKVISDQQESIADGGYRRVRTFVANDGRQFTRTEEILSTPRRTQKTVLQQNPSGSVTRYEEVLDREASGTFRRTQRFQNETGNVAVEITYGYQVTDPFVLTGGEKPLSFNSRSPFDSLRGTQLDIQA